MNYEYDELVLKHHGILGQKWGVRRYQNKDGTLTRAGRRHLEKEEAKARDKEIQDRRKAKRNVKLLSDEEIKRRTDRINNERKLKDLTDEDLDPGKTAMKKILSDSGKKVLGAAAAGTMAYVGKKIVYGFGGVEYSKSDAAKEFASYVFPNPNKKNK